MLEVAFSGRRASGAEAVLGSGAGKRTGPDRLDILDAACLERRGFFQNLLLVRLQYAI
jgi:hypothetical protein